MPDYVSSAFFRLASGGIQVQDDTFSSNNYQRIMKFNTLCVHLKEFCTRNNGHFNIRPAINYRKITESFIHSTRINL